MHSDGMSTIRTMDDYRDLFQHSAPVIAGRLLDEHFRGRDDASIIVVRSLPARAL
jgi:hypothetical protein